MGKIELRKWTVNDKESLMAICNAADRSYLTGRLPFPYTEADADWWLKMVEGHDGKDGIFRSVSVDGMIVGNISVEQKSDVYGKDAEIGYLLITEKWSQGIMTEAVGQICDIAFSSLDIIRITGLVYEPNSGSRRVLEKNGFLLEGILKNAVVKEGRVYDLCIYGKLK
ncbi:GNAT family N-acetyltransferase [Enterocloster sp. OA13]|uniref:GNAT family protein n=1 Tax=Enterocloster hominis (ex Hitch et al. 2024) TaxID=1917870 RepID=A0ABV1DER5_9FIRM|nr:GNAT family protein [Lachnoclostridium pacaense]MCC2876715.1 GNAT family N-acetyltransferase [Lachnoclostridium pacaense]MCH1950348.1 GNAT family N-acetyltransferase [Enterocloster sp. OA13]RJW48933.1 N-acetyltransferase [Clostridiales bacterium TF09-2AC]